MKIESFMLLAEQSYFFGYALAFLGVGLGVLLILRPSQRKDPDAPEKKKRRRD